MPPCPKPHKKEKKQKQRIKPKSKKSKKTSVGERTNLEILLDRLVSSIVILRDGDCVTPGRCSGQLTCSHYYGRTKKRTRWDLRNCNCQCFGHNGRHNNFQSYYGEYMLEHYSVEDLKDIAHLASFEKWQFTISELREMVDAYQKLYAQLLSCKAQAPVETARTEWKWRPSTSTSPLQPSEV
jgi:hypothetical protein